MTKPVNDVVAFTYPEVPVLSAADITNNVLCATPDALVLSDVSIVLSS